MTKRYGLPHEMLSCPAKQPPPISVKTKSKDTRAQPPRQSRALLGCRQHTPVHMNPVCAHIARVNVLENKRREERAEGGAESPSGRGALATQGGGWSPDSPLLTRDPVSEMNESLLKPWQQLFKLKLQPSFSRGERH